MREKGMKRRTLGSRIDCEENKCLGPVYSNYEERVQGPWSVVQRYGLPVIILDCKEGGGTSLGSVLLWRESGRDSLA